MSTLMWRSIFKGVISESNFGLSEYKDLMFKLQTLKNQPNKTIEGGSIEKEYFQTKLMRFQTLSLNLQ